jgi:colanic acid/amylovoran biosynthesis glycosyltransferase
MNVLYLIPEFPAQTHAFFWREACELRRRGHKVAFVSTRAPLRALEVHRWAEEAKAQTVYLWPMSALDVPRLLSGARSVSLRGILTALRIALLRHPRAWARTVPTLIFGWKLVYLARRYRADILHVHSCGQSALVAAYASLMGGVNYGLTLHGALDDYGPLQEIKWMRASYAIVITQRLLREVRIRLGNALPERIAVAPMGVQLDEFVRSAPYSSHHHGEALRLFSCGRLSPGKGHAVLIDAVTQLLVEGMNVQLRIAGEDVHGGFGYRKELEHRISTLGLSDRVTLLGAVSSDVIRHELERAHLFVFPSLREPLGVALMEAMAMGVPCVATNAGGIPELIHSGKDGLLVEPGCSAALAGGIRAIAFDPAAAAAYSREGRKTVEQRFHSGLSAEAIIACAP